MTIELPCKIGDTAWCIRNYKGVEHPTDGIVSEMYFNERMELVIALRHVGRGKWGARIFKTREDVLKAIEMEKRGYSD